MLNKPLLREIKARILAEPENFNMHHWHCQTAHCIGGWAQVLSGKLMIHTHHADSSSLLGLSGDRAGNLFYADEWPKKYRNQYLKAQNLKARARVAARLIDAVINTNGKVLE